MQTTQAYVIESETDAKVYTVGVREVEGEGFTMIDAFHVGGRPFYIGRSATGKLRCEPQGCEGWFYRGKCRHVAEALKMHREARA